MSMAPKLMISMAHIGVGCCAVGILGHMMLWTMAAMALQDHSSGRSDLEASLPCGHWNNVCLAGELWLQLKQAPELRASVPGVSGYGQNLSALLFPFTAW